MKSIGTLQIPEEQVTWFDNIEIEFDDGKNFMILNLKQGNQKLEERVIGIRHVEE